VTSLGLTSPPQPPQRLPIPLVSRDGGAIGTFSGQKVAQFNHEHPQNFIDRALLNISMLPDGRGGVSLA